MGGGARRPTPAPGGEWHPREDLHWDDCGLTAALGYDGTLTFTWDAAYRDEPGAERITPDAQDRYAIGGLWPWDNWPGAGEATPQP
ncbi:hypothetical protein [Streptomyces sp. NPDC001809]